MALTFDLFLIICMLLNLILLGSSRLTAVIRIASLHGMMISVLPLLLPDHPFDFRLLAIGIITLGVKGFVFPSLLTRSLRAANVRREIEPVLGYAVSVGAGVVAIAASFYFATRLETPIHETSKLVLPVSLSTIFAGLFLIIARRQALMQVVGYLLMENGIFVFGIALAHDEPFLVEMGILLDVVVAVFVMGIALFHISHEFDHIDVAQLSQLRD
jgi:hydrogenase-4 component E